MNQSLRSATAKYLSSCTTPASRTKNIQHLRTWQTYCTEAGISLLDVRGDNAQAFVEWMLLRYTPESTRLRAMGVRRWLDALVASRVIRGHGFGHVVLPPEGKRKTAQRALSDDEVRLLMSEAAKLGPRWEWLVGMLCFGGVEVAEILRIRSTDVRTWEGRTLVRVRTQTRKDREIPVNGRLEVLTVGLAAVFAPTTGLFGKTNAKSVREQLGKLTTATLGRNVTARQLRATAIARQYERGVPIPVIAKWLGLGHEKQVRLILGLEFRSPVEDVTDEDVAEQIVLEDDGDRFGSGSPADVLLDSMPDEGSE